MSGLRRSRPRRAVLAMAGLVLVSACARPPSESAEHTGTVREAIIGGTASDAADDATLLVVIHDAAGGEENVCTATLIAPRLVLTARHCLARLKEGNVSCSVDGNALTPGARIIGNYDPANVYFFAGKDRAPFTHLAPYDVDLKRWKPAGQGLEIIHDASSILCDHDLVLVLLRAAITSVPIATLRLDDDVVEGETLFTVGWGVALDTPEPSQRRRRTGVHTTAIGPRDQAPAVLGKNEFLFDESICAGDSGGPLFAEDTKALVGVVSRGGNGKDMLPTDPFTTTCVGADNIGTKLSPFRELFDAAFAKAGAKPILEHREPADGCALVPSRRRGSQTPPNDQDAGVALVAIACAVRLGRRVLGRTIARRDA